jgi:hypothetical protein
MPSALVLGRAQRHQRAEDAQQQVGDDERVAGAASPA